MSEASLSEQLRVVASGVAGRRRKIGRGPDAYQAFIPNPLPPALDLDPTIVRALSEADQAIGELKGLARMLPNPDLLMQPFIRKEAVLSSKIEGTQATITELYAFEAGQRGADRGDAREVLNYVRALNYGLGRVETLPVSLRLLRELHGLLMSGVRGEAGYPGEFRRTQNWIGPPGCLLKEATYVPPPTDQMLDALGDFERYLHADAELPVLVRLAIIHAQFEMIHPFIDGNGRIGRLLMVLLLVHWGVLPVPLLYLSAYFERKRDTYYDRLLGVSQEGNWHDWLLYFLEAVAEQSRDATARAKRLQDLQSEWRERVTRARASALTLRLVDRVFETPVLTIPQAQEVLGVTYPSAKLNVQKLVDAGILTVFRDVPYNRSYIALPLLGTLED
jgi:Fic family protein